MAERRKEMFTGDSDLPSLELGKLVDLADPNQVKKFLSLKGLNLYKGSLFMSSNEYTLPSDRFTKNTGDLPQGLSKGTKDENKNGNEDKQAVSTMQTMTDYIILPATNNTTVSPADVTMAAPGSYSNSSTGTESSEVLFLSTELFRQPKKEPAINTISWGDHDKGQGVGITFSDKNAIVIEDDLEAIGDESNMFGEGLQQQQQSDEKGNEPRVTVKTEGYHRFRYISEMGNRGTKRTFENHDGKEFVSIHVTNYCGNVIVLMFCVDIEGKPHPFYLDGEDCVDGLFSQIYTVNQDLLIRIKQINIICPTHKKYKDSLAKLRGALNQHKSCHKWQDDGCDVQLKTVDKSKVRLWVEVRYNDHQQCIVKLSDPIQDRKQGMDFKIHTIRDPCAPTSGSLEGNSILIVTTNDTNFPKNVDVILYDNSGWEVKADSVEIIKKCVVIFQAPPYTKDRDIKGNVTVSLALHDRDTGKRTPPVDFLYYVNSDIYGVQSKKRKLDSLQESSRQNPSEIRTAGQANNSVLQVVKRKIGNKRRTTDVTTSSAEMVEKVNPDSSEEKSERQSTLQDEPEVPSMPSLGFSQMQETQELVNDEIAALLLQYIEQDDRKAEACNNKQDSVPVTKQPNTLSKGKLSVTSLPNGMLRVSYKGKVVGDVTQESWCQMIQKKRLEKYSERNVSTSSTTENQHIYPEQCLHESTLINSDSQNQNPAKGSQQSLDLLTAILEQQAQFQQLVKEYMSQNQQQQSGDGIHESYDLGSRTDQQLSVMPQHHIPITLAQTEDNAFVNSDNAIIYSLVQLDDGKFILQPSSAESQQMITDYQSIEEDKSQHYIIQDPYPVTNMCLTLNQATTPTHQMIEGQQVLVQHIQQHPTDEQSPTDAEQLKQIKPWIHDVSSSSIVSTQQHVQASTSNMHSASPACSQNTNPMHITTSFQDHNYSDLPSSDLECDNKFKSGDNSIIMNEDLADNDLEYDTVPAPAIEVEV